MYPLRQVPRATRQTGFTLVEVLIAVVVLSIGLMGVAAMQFVGLRDSNKSNERSLATVLAYDISDRMRANVQGATAGGYLMTAGTAPTAKPAGFCSTDFTGTTIANVCNSAEMAAADAFEWYTSVQNTLPGGLGQITCVDADAGVDADACTLGSVFTITVMWDDERSGDTGTGCDPDEPGDLLCLSITTEL